MTEQYDVAAWRHLNAAGELERACQYDDAAYHFGLAGENAIKQILRASLVEAAWLAIGRAHGQQSRRALANTPMRGHIPTLQNLVTASRPAILAFAVGRHAGLARTELFGPGFLTMLRGWSIDIRYADTDYTPVAPATCRRWGRDAADLVLKLVI
jgi:hypothetical protein